MAFYLITSLEKNGSFLCDNFPVITHLLTEVWILDGCFGDKTESHFTYILKLNTYISSTDIYFKISARLFVHLEAAVVAKAKVLFFSCFLWHLLQLVLILFPLRSLLLTMVMHHRESDDKQGKKEQHFKKWHYQSYLKVKTEIFLCLIVNLKK